MNLSRRIGCAYAFAVVIYVCVPIALGARAAPIGADAIAVAGAGAKAGARASKISAEQTEFNKLYLQPQVEANWQACRQKRKLKRSTVAHCHQVL